MKGGSAMEKTLISFVCDGDEKNKNPRRLYSISEIIGIYEKQKENQDTK